MVMVVVCVLVVMSFGSAGVGVAGECEVVIGGEGEDAEGLIERAKGYIFAGQYSEGLALLGYVAARFGRVRIGDIGTGRAMVCDEVDRIVAELPVEVLCEYRIGVDAKVRELVCGGGVWSEVGECRDARVLRWVVRDYFLSSYGDEAAYMLGCLLLDRYDFQGARRELRRIVEVYPDSTVDEGELLMRLGLANARLGDVVRTEAIVAGLERRDGVDMARVEMIRSELTKRSERRFRSGMKGK